ncbi:RpiR family transcriptional regulator [Bacillus oleivorans]|uniref:RpiR family transcriptional regulator n=1 Tax=Bacillus oleivorans TaxID=1448271 RepID=A0A285CJC5_9BACI|nr:MurR/RpiR family transcriptional regulator [Bacillus oleivorans]SNX67118.1 RpiR family transcriptional regulator [Bacillus oleivorans]
MKETKNGQNKTELDSLSVYSLIQSSYGGLSITEKRIADLILNSPEKIIYNTVTLVSEELEIAQSTVTRFCRSIGLRGFQDLKIRLARDLEREDSTNENHEDLSFPQKFAQICSNSVRDASLSLDEYSIKQAADLIASANKIVIFGVGESGPMALLLKIKLMGLGLTVDAQIDSHLQSIAAAHLNENDVAIGISQQGSTRDIVNILESIQNSGVKTICITGHGKSPITEVSDIALVCVNRKLTNIKEVESFKSKTSILYVIELLTIILTMKLNSQSPDFQKNLWKTTESILDKLY